MLTFILILGAIAFAFVAYIRWCKASLERGARSTAPLLASIVGWVCGLVLAIKYCDPAYDYFWPRGNDKNQGGLALFVVLMLAPALMTVGAIVGIIVGAIASGAFSKSR